MAQFKNIKGTKDLLPHETRQWRNIENIIHDFMELHSYGEIRTPSFEQTNLFTRGIGEDTDIVSKEMYSWIDQGGSNLTLKPELTAPAVRAYIQHHLANQSPLVRLYYLDSLFRRERPQKGRLRQFHQFGIEAFGSLYPEQDAEVISMAYHFYKIFDLKNITVRLNSIGSTEIRPIYLNILRESMQPYIDNLCPTCQGRLNKNALRIFDCKNPDCEKILNKYAPSILENLSDDDRVHFDTVQSLLTDIGIPYVLDKTMVRGLDYYTRTTFEILSTTLGAQNSLCGGGRYDKLVENMGGKPTPSVGFAAGFERLIIALGENNIGTDTADIYMVVLGTNALSCALKIADELRKKRGLRISVETLKRSLKSQMREANRSGAQFAIIIGEDELENNAVIVKQMNDGKQKEVPIDKLVDEFHRHHNCGCS